MAREKRPKAKTQTLSLRLDPKTRFALEYVARVGGQSITTVVERSVLATARTVGMEHQLDDNNNIIPVGIWSDYWDPSEGVRTLKLLSDERYPTTYEEDEVLAFTKAHWEFFYDDEYCFEFRPRYIDVLWPGIDRYLDIWKQNRQTDYWAAGSAMKADLEKAQLTAPSWPRPEDGVDARSV